MKNRARYILKNILTTLLLVASATAFSCQCPSLTPITKDACANYNVIFSGFVDSVSACDDKEGSIAYFTIDEAYKGNVAQQVQVLFDCASSCLMSFAHGDNWIIYANYKKFDVLEVSLCEHSRKLFADVSQDIYMIAAQKTFAEEKEFLKNTLGTIPFKESSQQVTGRNEQPSGINKLILLAISFSAMALVYFIIKRKNVK